MTRRVCDDQRGAVQVVELASAKYSVAQSEYRPTGVWNFSDNSVAMPCRCWWGSRSRQPPVYRHETRDGLPSAYLIDAGARLSLADEHEWRYPVDVRLGDASGARDQSDEIASLWRSRSMVTTLVPRSGGVIATAGCFVISRRSLIQAPDRLRRFPASRISTPFEITEDQARRWAAKDSSATTLDELKHGIDEQLADLRVKS